MGYKPSNGVPIYTSNFIMLFARCSSCEMEHSRRWVGLKAGNMKKEERLGRRNTHFEELKNLPAMPWGDGICFKELRLL